ncbi:hypothetical protein EZJ43_09535 [Pedobacter changchengzhani]|uniref:Uncharacterized protein n=1 Tax=Pedobacter changchengzhani TaxID=2529274 RepID=A0A4R5MLV2_9SPHI|nr:hypothetical protein [Pedobacter changchengzhani]TDG36235.1 hypothetical protein EZJ43_09535 [Pedobacter changchengzhani]
MNEYLKKTIYIFMIEIELYNLTNNHCCITYNAIPDIGDEQSRQKNHIIVPLTNSEIIANF